MSRTEENQPACPNCHRPFQVGRERCIWCGADLTQIKAVLRDLRCPSCNHRLEEHRNNEAVLYMCAGCGGAWMTAVALEKLETFYKQASPLLQALEATAPSQTTPAAGALSSRDPGAKPPKLEAKARLAAGIVDQGGAQVPSRAALEAPAYRRCPQCGGLMARRRYHKVSSVVVDECLGHGAWFDKNELDQAMAFLKSGGLDKRKMREEMEASDARRHARSLHSLHRSIRGMRR